MGQMIVYSMPGVPLWYCYTAETTVVRTGLMCASNTEGSVFVLASLYFLYGVKMLPRGSQGASVWRGRDASQKVVTLILSFLLFRSRCQRPAGPSLYYSRASPGHVRER